MWFSAVRKVVFPSDPTFPQGGLLRLALLGEFPENNFLALVLVFILFCKQLLVDKFISFR